MRVCIREDGFGAVGLSVFEFDADRVTVFHDDALDGCAEINLAVMFFDDIHERIWEMPANRRRDNSRRRSNNRRWAPCCRR